MTARRNAEIATSINIGTGIWLVAAPFVLTYTVASGALWNDVVCGVLIVILAGIRRSNILHNVGLSYFNAGIGVWLIVAPFVLGYIDKAAFWNDIIVGLLVLIVGIWSASATKSALHSSELTR